MSDAKKEKLRLKLSMEKETLRVLDPSQLHLLAEAIGGHAVEDPSSCSDCSCCHVSCYPKPDC